MSIILTIITLAILLYKQPSKNELCLQAFEKIKDLQYNGIVIEKYKDFNHSTPVFIVESYNQNKVTVSDFRDISGLFNFIEIQDSIIKERHSYEVKIIRNSDERIFIIDYGCIANK